MAPLWPAGPYSTILPSAGPKRITPLSKGALLLAGNEVPNSSYTGELGVYDSDSCTNSNKHTLVVLRGTVNDKPVSCLVDSGATHNFLSLNWTARTGCVTSPLPDKLHVNLADGRKML